MRTVGALFVLALALMVIRIILPFLNTFPEQDECTFGPISNDQYRRLLAEARRLERDKWPSLRARSEGDLERMIEERITELAPIKESSLPLKLAASHAVLRALGAEYLANWPTSKDRADFEAQISRHAGGDVYTRPRGFVSFYQVDVMHLGSVEPFVRTAQIVSEVRLFADKVPNVSSRPRLRDGGAPTIGVLGSKWFDSNPRATKTLGLNCPPVPPDYVIKHYDELNPK